MLKRFVKRLLSCLLLAALFVLVVIGGTLGVQGWRLYRATAAQKPIAGLYDEISSRPGFASCDQLPQTYIDAVISVEDSRFERHRGRNAEEDDADVGHRVREQLGRCVDELQQRGSSEGGDDGEHHAQDHAEDRAVEQILVHILAVPCTKALKGRRHTACQSPYGATTSKTGPTRKS